MKRLLLFHMAIGGTKLRSIIAKAGLTSWIPFVTDYNVVKSLEETLDGVASRIDIGRTLQSEAKLMRRPFYEVTAELGNRYDSMEWWSGGIAERNTMRNKLFLYCCYVSLARAYMGNGENLCIIAENKGLIENIAMVAKSEGYEVKSWCPRFILHETLVWTFLSGLGRLLQHAGVGILTKLNRIYHSLITKKYDKTINPDIILHTWVDEKCLGDDGSFNDRYFTILPEYLKAKGYNVATLVTFAYRNLKRSFWDALTFIRLNKNTFIIPEDYYRLQDYWFPVTLWFKRLRFEFDGVVIRGVDCSILFNEDNRKDTINFIVRYYPLFKRLASDSVRPKVVIDGFENMVSDKMILLGIRDFMPGTSLFGFYHMAPPPNVLCFFTEKKEMDRAPLPDKIICNGPLFRDILIKEHFPPERIFVGAALRYQYLYKIKRSTTVTAGFFRILLVLPIEKDASIELFYKVRQALNGMEGCLLTIKPHPMEVGVVEKIKKDFPPGTQVFTGSMDEAMNICDVVISTATSAVLDCVMADKEVIRVGRSTQIDLDPLEWFMEFGQPCNDIDELKVRLGDVRKRMKDPLYVPPRYSSLLPELFSPVTEDTMRPFLPPAQNEFY